jgi:hypothetical protein
MAPGLVKELMWETGVWGRGLMRGHRLVTVCDGGGKVMGNGVAVGSHSFCLVGGGVEWHKYGCGWLSRVIGTS